MERDISTFSGMLNQLAKTYPNREAISLPGGQDLTFADLDHRVDATARRFRSSGIERGDVVVIAFSNTVEFLILMQAVIRCRGVAVALPSTLTREEFEFYLSFYEVSLVLTGSAGSNCPAARAAAVRCVPYAVVFLDFSSDDVEVSFVLPSERGRLRDPAAVAATVDLADVVNKPWDTALLLHTPGTMSTGYEASFTQKQLALCATSRTDLVKLRELDPCLAGVPLSQLNQGLLETLTRMIRIPAMVGVDAGTRADESDLKLKDVLLFSAGAVIGVIGSLLNKQDPEAAAKKASVTLLLLYGALISALMGQLLKVGVGRFHGFFMVVNVLCFYSGAACLVVSPLHPGYSHAAFALTVAAGELSIFVQLRRLLWSPPQPPPVLLPRPKAEGALEMSVSKGGRWPSKGIPGKSSRKLATVNDERGEPADRGVRFSSVQRRIGQEKYREGRGVHRALRVNNLGRGGGGPRVSSLHCPVLLCTEENRTHDRAFTGV